MNGLKEEREWKKGRKRVDKEGKEKDTRRGTERSAEEGIERRKRKQGDRGSEEVEEVPVSGHKGAVLQRREDHALHTELLTQRLLPSGLLFIYPSHQHHVTHCVEHIHTWEEEEEEEIDEEEEEEVFTMFMKEVE